MGDATSIMRYVTSIMGNAASFMGIATSIKGNVTSVIGNVTSIMRYVTSIIGNATSIMGVSECIEVPGVSISLSPQPPFPFEKGKGEKTRSQGEVLRSPSDSAAASRYISKPLHRYIFPPRLDTFAHFDSVVFPIIPARKHSTTGGRLNDRAPGHRVFRNATYITVKKQ
jgi:hypothetical protein